jgi:hypothetical protein
VKRLVPRVALHVVQFELISLHVEHSGGHMWHIKKVELSIEFVGHLSMQIPSALSNFLET